MYAVKNIIKLTLVVLFLGLMLSEKIPQVFANSSWSSTASIQYPRYSAQAITLPNGKVLVMGGHTPGDTYDNTSELYDPATATWSLTGDLHNNRSDPMAVLLQDGTVLAINFQESETYDPQTEQWTLAGPTVNAHLVGTATLLPSGKVFVAGGLDKKETDVYDPSTRSYSFSGVMSTERYWHTSILLPNGKVLIIGGNGCGCGNSNGPETLSSAEIYDPSTHSFTSTGSMNVPRAGAAAILLPDGKVLIVGGTLNQSRYSGSSDPASTAEIYDPTLGTWSMTGNLASGRYGFGPLRLLSNGHILAAGGTSAGTSEEYNPSTGMWDSPISLIQPHCGATNAALQDGRILLIAGYDCFSPDNKLTNVEVYQENLTPTMLQPSADSYIKQGAQNENEGSSSFLRLQSSGHNRGLIKFDQSQIQAAVSSSSNFSAKLRFTISSNSNGWGSSGRTINLHRFTKGWLEGNGFNSEQNPSSKGTGSGVTWNCAIDSDIHNQNDDCSNVTSWNMATNSLWPFVSSPSASVLISNNQTGMVDFDVTSDVQFFLDNPSQNYGWLIKKTDEGQTGSIYFASKETTSSPELIITPL